MIYKNTDLRAVLAMEKHRLCEIDERGGHLCGICGETAEEIFEFGGMIFCRECGALILEKAVESGEKPLENIRRRAAEAVDWARYVDSCFPAQEGGGDD